MYLSGNKLPFTFGIGQYDTPMCIINNIISVYTSIHDKKKNLDAV